ncbi:MAG: hypothetical protein M3144_01700 [Actinomycetota bacterium]|nr:hypothetical protein [Actinomycetota bacterium]
MPSSRGRSRPLTHIGIFGDRRARLPRGWTKETVVGLFADSDLDAIDAPGPGASITFFGLFSDATVRIPAGFRVSEGGFSLFGDRRVDVSSGEAGEIRIDAYGLFCDLKVTELPRETG